MYIIYYKSFTTKSMHEIKNKFIYLLSSINHQLNDLNVSLFVV